MSGIAKVGDICIATCGCHERVVQTSGILITGSPSVLANGSPVSHLGSMAVCSCGHMTMVATASPNVIVTGAPAARMGDVVVGCPVGVIATGSANTIAN